MSELKELDQKLTEELSLPLKNEIEGQVDKNFASEETKKKISEVLLDLFPRLSFRHSFWAKEENCESIEIKNYSENE